MRAKIGPGFLARWVLATAIGWVGGVFVAIILSHLVVNLFYPEETNLIVGLCVGGTVAALQVLAVRRRVGLPLAWIWGGMVTMAPPTIMVVVMAELGWNLSDAPVQALLWVVSVAVGAVGVLVQAVSLRRLTDRWLLWIPASAVVWAVTLASSSVVDMLAGGIVYGIASGALLSILLRMPPSGSRVASLSGGPSGGPDPVGHEGVAREGPVAVRPAQRGAVLSGDY